jgi:hypothetical protein
MKTTIAAILIMAACHNADVASARKQAEEFAKEIPGAVRVQCNDSDSDGDGYVSCTIFRGSNDPLPIQCGAENWCVTNCAHGCRLAIPTTKGGSK